MAHDMEQTNSREGTLMRIGIDLRSLEGGAQHRGIGRYATQLIEALSKIDHVNEYVFFVSHSDAKAPIFELHYDFKKQAAHGNKPGLRRRVKFIRTLHVTPEPLPVDKFNLDVFFHIDINQPILVRKTPVVSVLFDIIPFLDKYKRMYQYVHFGGLTLGELIFYFRLRLKWKVAEKTLYNYLKSSAVVSISEHSRKDILSYIPSLNPKKVITIPLAASEPHVTNEKSIKRMQKLNLNSFLFYIGGADPRKGLVNLAKEMEDIWKQHPDTQLVLAGKEITDMDVPEAVRLAEVAASSSRPKQIIRIGLISDGELAWLYKNAIAFIFPSQYEGFGLPILEAMQMGCPVISFANSSIPEVAGEAALLIKDDKPLAPTINRLLSNKALRQKLSQRGKEQSALFTWEKTARETLKILEKSGKKK